MKTKHKRYALFIGRWQPFHLGHKYLIDQALKQGKNVAIAIRNTELSEKNPFTYEQRKEMIQRIYGKRVKVFKICDIESINIGRKVGYKVNRVDVPQKIKKISGTKVRESRFAIDIPEEIRNYIASVSPTFWFFGLPCSGKTTLAKSLKNILEDNNRRVIHLDGDILRKGLNQDLGFSNRDRKENLRRAAYLAKYFNEQGNTVLCSFVAPKESMRKMIKKIIPNLTFIYVKASVEECAKRDVKGMYFQARQGKIKNFTGVSDKFEEPKNFDIMVNAEKKSIDDCVKKIIKQAKAINL
jgi:adenylyl-sulfate kinase